MQINPKQKIFKKRKNISVIENGKAIEKNQQKTKNFIYVKEIEKTWKNPGDLGSIPGLGRSPGEGKGYPLQYSGLENSMDYRESMGSQSRT